MCGERSVTEEILVVIPSSEEQLPSNSITEFTKKTTDSRQVILHDTMLHYTTVCGDR